MKIETGKPCPVMLGCGGCQLLGVPYEKQLALKQKRVETLLSPYCKVSPIIGMENPYHYRNKVHAAFAWDEREHVISGVYAAGSHRVIPVENCLLEDEEADLIIRSVRKLMVRFHIEPHDEDSGYGLLRHVLIRVGKNSGQILVTLVIGRPNFPSRAAFVQELLRLHPAITTVVINLNSRHTSMVLGPSSQTVYGRGFILDSLCGMRFALSPQSFYQINAVQTEKLYTKAIEYANFTGQEKVIDAYCGIGTIGLISAPHVKEVVGVELNPDAVRDAEKNARRNDVKNIRFFRGDAGQFLRGMAIQHEKADVLVMDPPRAGSDARFLGAVAVMKPSRIVYVSCMPETLARDVGILKRAGYRATLATPVDMFPHTEHVENVILLSKGNVDVKHIKVDISLEDMDLSELQTHATYTQIKARVKEQTGLDVSNLYIAQVKAKCGIKERANYNHAKSADAKQPVCPAEKEKAIREALKYFGMI